MRSLLRVLWSRLRSLVRKDRLDRDFDDELTTHLELLTGLAWGAVAAFIIVRLTASAIADLLFGLTATDTANLVAATAVMVVVALAACTVPALRATRIDPVAVVRDE